MFLFRLLRCLKAFKCVVNVFVVAVVANDCLRFVMRLFSRFV